MTGTFDVTADELRAVAAFVVAEAEDVLAVFTAAVPDDPRPAEALAAARRFVGGEPRSRLQRVASMAAHRAAAAAPHEAARLAAQAAGDAASAAYLHPIPKAHQVGHVLRASANAARIAELAASSPDDGADDGADAGAVAAESALERSRDRAGPTVVAVLRRYPPAAGGGGRVAELVRRLDHALRVGSAPDGPPDGTR